MPNSRPLTRVSIASPIITQHHSEESILAVHRPLLPPPGHHGRFLKSGAPRLLKKRSSRWFILGTVCVALFTDSFIYGVLVPVVPFLLNDRCAVPNGQEQVLTSALFAIFGVAILIGSPICGYLADHTNSRRPLLLAAIPLLTASLVLTGLSTAVSLLLISRLLAGAATAIAWTVGLALTVDTVGKEEVGQWMGAAISSNSVGLVISPLLGGIVYDRAGLKGVLGIVSGLVVVNAVLIWSLIEKRVAEKWYLEGPEVNKKSLVDRHNTFSNGDDETGRDTGRNSDTITTPSATEHSRQPWLTTSSAAHASMPPLLRLLLSPRILASSYGVFTQFGLLASFDAFLPLFVKRRFGWGPLGAGLIFLNIALPALAGPLAGKISDRYGPRRVALAGCVLTTPPLVLLRVIGYEASVGQVVLLCGLLILIGLFLTLIISPLAADLSYAVDEMEAAQPGVFGPSGAYAQAYALFNCAMAAACVVGPILCGVVQDRYGMKTLAWVLGVWCASATVPVALFIGDDVAPRYRQVESTGEE